MGQVTLWMPFQCEEGLGHRWMTYQTRGSVPGPCGPGLRLNLRPPRRGPGARFNSLPQRWYKYNGHQRLWERLQTVEKSIQEEVVVSAIKSLLVTTLILIPVSSQGTATSREIFRHGRQWQRSPVHVY